MLRSLITLKALTYAPTGGIVAAATTSLPERIGGVRNWDYRFCWLRDATFTLYALMKCGYEAEAREWREWLLRAVAGKPSELQIMYGIAGERRLPEVELDWLPGYEGSTPVRIGNAASCQFQLDVYGEVMDAMYQCRRAGLEPDENAWQVEQVLLDFLETGWRQPDEGIWEVRGPRRHFTHSKVMAWVAVDRAVKAIERWPLRRRGPPVARGCATRSTTEVCTKGFDPELGSFVQYYGSKELDASLLMMPLVGFLAPRRSARARHGRGDRARSDARRSRRPLPNRHRRRRPARRARGRSSRAPSGWRTTGRFSAAGTRRSACSSGSSRCGTTSGSSPRSTIRRRTASSATSRKPSATSAW